MDSALAAILDREPLDIVDEIPRFSTGTDEDQKQTEQSFAYKWGRRASYDSDRLRDTARRWLLHRYGFDSPEAMRQFFAGHELSLDAGCGSAFTSSLWLTPGWSGGTATWVGVDISEAVDVARQRLHGIERIHLVQADLLDLPFRECVFGAILCEGVLHHTPSTEEAFRALVPLLDSGGEFLFYVYRRKAPVREFADDHVRKTVSWMPPDEAWDALRSLTELGRALAELRAEVVVPDVPLLGITAGQYDVQRLIYWNFAKLFWNADLTFDENLHVNFDWYHPRYAHRHTEDEVRRWCAEAHLDVKRFNVEPSGFTVRAVKR
jgi:SAM-dependent methyltransferase